MHATLPLLQVSDFPALGRGAVTTLQVNLGYRCNQSCLHCHVNAGPNRTEMMDEATMALIVEVLRARGIATLASLSAWPAANLPAESLSAAIAPLRIARTATRALRTPEVWRMCHTRISSNAKAGGQAGTARRRGSARREWARTPD